MESLPDTGVAIKVLGDTQPVSQWEVTGELRRRLIRAFLQENVRVPFPPHVVVGPGDAHPQGRGEGCGEDGIGGVSRACGVLGARRTPAGRRACTTPVASSCLLLCAGPDFAGKPGRIIRQKVGHRRRHLFQIPQLRVFFHRQNLRQGRWKYD